jgi:protein TonB
MRKSTKSTAKAHGNGFCSETSNLVNPKGSKQDANLRKNGFLHFQIGLIVAMLLVYFGLEFAFSKVEPKVFSQKENDPELMEFQPERFVVEMEKADKKPIQKVINPEEFIVKPDDFEVPKALEFKNKPAESTSPMGVDEVNFIKDIPEVVIPFIALEDAPIFPGCEKVEKLERKACFKEKMLKHIRKNFKYPEAAIATGTEGKVFVMFTIGKQGFIEDIQLQGPSKILENEAARIIDKLPQMTPG